MSGLAFFAYSLISFGNSFRVGIDLEQPGDLITAGAFSINRNPIYSTFALILMGNFLIHSNWILLVYLIVGIWVFHRQVLREEGSLKKTYGGQFE